MISVRRTSPYLSFSSTISVRIDFQNQAWIAKQGLKAGNLGHDLVVLVFDLLAFQRSQTRETHIQNGIRLDFTEREPRNHVVSGVFGRVGRPDQRR